MPVHDWQRVKPGIFHDFHHEWLSSMKHALNGGLLPEGYYSMAEQHVAGFEPDSDVEYRLPKRKPLTAVSYECDFGVRAYVENFAIGDALAKSPLFLEPGGCVEVPLEKTYQRAFAEVPKRWRDVLNGKKTA